MTGEPYAACAGVGSLWREAVSGQPDTASVCRHRSRWMPHRHVREGCWRQRMKASILLQCSCVQCRSEPGDECITRPRRAAAPGVPLGTLGRVHVGISASRSLSASLEAQRQASDLTRDRLMRGGAQPMARGSAMPLLTPRSPSQVISKTASH